MTDARNDKDDSLPLCHAVCSRSIQIAHISRIKAVEIDPDIEALTRPRIESRSGLSVGGLGLGWPSFSRRAGWPVFRVEAQGPGDWRVGCWFPRWFQRFAVWSRVLELQNDR